MVDVLFKFPKLVADVAMIIKIDENIEVDGLQKNVRQRLAMKWLEQKYVPKQKIQEFWSIIPTNKTKKMYNLTRKIQKIIVICNL